MEKHWTVPLGSHQQWSEHSVHPQVGVNFFNRGLIEFAALDDPVDVTGDSLLSSVSMLLVLPAWGRP